MNDVDDNVGLEREYFVYTGKRGGYWGFGWDIPTDVTHVKVHLSANAINDQAFLERRQLEIAILNDGLEEIGVSSYPML